MPTGWNATVPSAQITTAPNYITKIVVTVSAPSSSKIGDIGVVKATITPASNPAQKVTTTLTTTVSDKNSNDINVIPNHDPGTYAFPVNVTLNETNGRVVDIYYTTNGNDPGFSSLKYDSSYPIIVSKTTTIKYFAYDRTTKDKTSVKSAAYIITGDAVKKITVTDSAGISLSGAMVQLSSQSGKNYLLTESVNGTFGIPDLAPDNYAVKIKKLGYNDLNSTVDLTGTGKVFTFKLVKATVNKLPFSVRP